MYYPAINEQLVRTLYRIKRFHKKPITKLANELILESLKTIDKEEICLTCIRENNQECDVCALSSIRK